MHVFLALALSHPFADPFHTVRSKCFSNHTFHISTYNSQAISESDDMTHRLKLLKGFVVAWPMHSNFLAIKGNQTGGVHRKALCHCSTWPWTQHDIFTYCCFFSHILWKFYCLFTVQNIHLLTQSIFFNWHQQPNMYSEISRPHCKHFWHYSYFLKLLLSIATV